MESLDIKFSIQQTMKIPFTISQLTFSFTLGIQMDYILTNELHWSYMDKQINFKDN